MKLVFFYCTFVHFFLKCHVRVTIEAAKSINVNELENKVLATIKTFGRHGCISDDVLKILNYLPYSSVTARYCSLNRKNLIKYTGESRKGNSGRGQRVMVEV